MLSDGVFMISFPLMLCYCRFPRKSLNASLILEFRDDLGNDFNDNAIIYFPINT